ncbi:hypothetical protein D3C72_1921110 [compost metagenome]
MHPLELRQARAQEIAQQRPEERGLFIIEIGEGFSRIFHQRMQRRTIFRRRGNGNDVFRAEHAELEGLRIEQHRHFGVRIGQKKIALPVHQRIEVFLHAAGIGAQY